LAVAQVQVTSAPTLPYITRIALSGTNLTIYFTGGTNDPASDFTLISSTNVNGAYTNVSGPTNTGSFGSYQAHTSVNGSLRFYRVER
jgi:hypothetical protein